MRALLPGVRGRKVSTRTGVVLLSLLVFGGPLRAQDEGGTDVSADALTGSWSPRAHIEKQGIRPFALLTSEVWGNIAGGLRTGGWYNHLLDFGLELDTAKLGWWDGGTFLAQAHWVQNSRDSVTFGDYTGAFNPISSILAQNHARVFNLYYQQSWGDGAWVVKAGQIALDDDFLLSDYSCLFINSAFGAMPSQVGTPLASSLGNPTPFPIYPVAAPGLFVCVRPAEGIYSQVGLYCGIPGADEADNYGFDWTDQRSTELGLFWESGYQYHLSGRMATTRLGLSYHTGPLDHYGACTSDETPATTQSVPNFYLIQDLQLAVDSEGKAKVGCFCRGGVTPEPDRSMVAAYADAGVNWFGPIRGRAEDVAGIAVSYTHFGRDYERSTGPEGVASSETTVEATYSAQLTRWMALQADLQVLLNPAVNRSSGSRETATVIGLRTRISF